MKPILFSLGCTETRIKWVWQGKSHWVWHAPNTTEGSSQPAALHLLERFAHSSSAKPSFSAITSWRSLFSMRQYLQTPLLFETIQKEGKETEHVIVLLGLVVGCCSLHKQSGRKLRSLVVGICSQMELAVTAEPGTSLSQQWLFSCCFPG